MTTLTKEGLDGYYRSANESCTTSYGLTVGRRPPQTVSDSVSCTQPSAISDLFNSSHYLKQYNSLKVEKTISYVYVYHN